MIKKIILLISVFMLMFSLYQIVPYFYYNVKQETIENDIHKIAYSTPPTNPTTKKKQLLTQFLILMKGKIDNLIFKTLKMKMKILLLGYKFQIQK